MDADNIPLPQQGVTAQLDQRRSHIESMAAAYYLHTTIAPNEAVLVEQREGMTTRWWFERKGDQ